MKRHLAEICARYRERGSAPCSRHHFAVLTAACAFALIVAGGLVTSTGSSLAVPDWPLSYGQFFPPMTGGILFEHGHRMIAGAVAILTLILAVWTWARDGRVWVRFLAAGALGGIVLQAVLGGITVLYRLPHPVSIAHACLGQTVFCLLVALAQASSPSFTWSSLGEMESIGLGRWSSSPLALVAMVYVQLILGAVVRHTGAAVAAHVLWALATSAAALWAGYRALTNPVRASWPSRPVWILLGLLPVQLVLGISALAARLRPAASPLEFWPVALRTGHVACGAAILAASVVWFLRASRRPAAAL